MHKSAFEEHLQWEPFREWHRESSRLTDRGELLEGRGQVHGISQSSSPGSRRMSSLAASLAATKANSKAVGPGNILRKE